MRNNLDNFEKMIQNSVRDHESPYEADQWARMEKRLDSSSGGSGSGMKKFWIAASITAIVIGGGLTWYALDNSTTPAENNQSVENRDKDNPELNKGNLDGEIVQEKETPSDNNPVNNDQDNDLVNTHDNIKEADHSSHEDVISEKSENEHGDGSIDPADHLTIDQNDGTPDDQLVEDDPIYEPENAVSAPVASFEASTFEACTGEEITFTPVERTDGDYIWNFGDGKSSGRAITSHRFDAPGQYIVTLETRSRLDNSVTDQSDGVMITVRETPDADFSYEQDANAARPVVHLINKTDKATSWSWNFKDGHFSDEKDPDHIFNKKGRYDVELIATNQYGCASAHTATVEIDADYNLLAPKALTRDGDGINEEWIPEALTVLDFPFTLTIYSKSGKQVFQTKSANRKWDGFDQTNGKMCQEGFYVWYVTLKNEKGLTEEYKGTIMLLK